MKNSNIKSRIIGSHSLSSNPLIYPIFGLLDTLLVSLWSFFPDFLLTLLHNIQSSLEISGVCQYSRDLKKYL